MRKSKTKCLIKYEIVVDGRVCGVLWDSARTQKEIKRLQRLKGIEIKGPLYEQ